ncbi:hypothetical protein AQI88_39145 [Streptomyces cellostaticus]|uniref:Uncharacterized protein n=1 Tax=Streptomyces cellostaticus TaxID=67285 RepID=A0A101NBP5_9ACTN|nr:hypothetical protein [Streptomyces cellostaticus]KUM90166.1 hypothetical protein AQI88_39145 [Streptomyces cellostaticus]GHI10269.1 hypothetical protein Scel_85900 [Streptomyces cellostaticus]
MTALPYRVTEAEMNRFRETLQDSPLRFVECDHGHPIDAFRSYWKMHDVYVMHGVPLVRFACDELRCLSCGVYDIAAQCRSFGYIGVPRDSGDVVARGYPRHTSDEWRAGAKVIPRLDGVYSRPVSRGEFIIAMPTADVDRCLFFTDAGEVFEFTVSYRHGFGSARKFHEATQAALRGFDNSRADNVRGLYTVSGNQLVCHMLAPTDTSYQYHAKLKGSVSELKMVRTDGQGKRLGKAEFSYRKPR